MPKIKWAGIIGDELDQYQKADLAEHAKKMEMPSTINEMMIKALPFLIVPFLTIILSMFIKTFLAGERIVDPLFALMGLGAGFAGLMIHEYLHAIVYPSDATVYIGVYPKAFAPVALASYPLKRGRFILMALLPLILGIVPIVIFWFSPMEAKARNGFMFGFAIMGLISPYPDCFNVFEVLRQTPAGCRIQFWGNDTYWIEK